MLLSKMDVPQDYSANDAEMDLKTLKVVLGL